MMSDAPIFQIQAGLADILKFGHTPYGERRIIDIRGGRASGPKLNGPILPGGADWQIIRADGVADIQARYTIETDRGGYILVNSEGCAAARPR